ncbi:hypothetical protein Bca52824_066015 [Brassica carinata]|uniref:RNase H type-1 domain-containing protein n=1 Tax=Brassica carinata TaxID=52824 RepID=A0A8X7QJF4_BRACI|nr:hypothetical protein Bca52824_066015 [Brassica carinata]
MYKGTTFTSHYTVPPVGLSGGLALSWKDNVKLEVLFSSPNFFVSYIYGAPNKEDRPMFWESMKALGLGRTEPWLLTGDFNDLLDNSEKVGGPLRWEGSFLAFQNFVSENGLWDLQFSGNSLSWRGTRYSLFIQSRLDRAMANIDWMEMFPAARSEYLRFEGSDHRPLVTHFDKHLKKKKGLLRYDRRLSEKPEIRELVETTWKTSDTDSVLTKINQVRCKLIEWAKIQAARAKEHISSHQVLLEQALSDSNPNQDRIEELKLILNMTYAEAEAFWRQRSRIQWLNGGDRNSSFFHAVTRGRRACNIFSIIEDEAGIAHYEEDQIMMWKYLGLPKHFRRKKGDIFASIVDQIQMLTKAIKAAKEWQESLPIRKHVSASTKDLQVRNTQPQVPTTVSLLYSDAAWNGSTSVGGLAWVCTDFAGKEMFKGTDAGQYVALALVAEALAMKEGLMKAASAGLKDIICYSDSKCLIDTITRNKSVIALRGILHDISVLRSSFNSISFKFISRVCNDRADRLAKNALFQFGNNLSEIDNNV